MSPGAKRRPTYEQVQEERKERSRGAARMDVCDRCQAPVLKGETRPPASVKVMADPRVLVGPLEGYARQHGLMTYCLRRGALSALPDRIVWRCPAYTRRVACRSQHDVVAEHRCPDQKGRYKAGMADIYGTERAAKRPEPKRDRYGRYVLPDPRSGEERSWQRVTTFCKITTDQYNLSKWQLRTCAKGLSEREDLVALASTYDITEDAKKFDELCEEAKTAGGAKSAANTGTALHGMTERFDDTGNTEGIPGKYLPRVMQYADALEERGVVVVPEMIERIVCHTGYEVVGTLDRVFKLDDGDYVIGDLKTGKNLTYSQNEIAVQLYLYAVGFNTHGVWDHVSEAWVDPGFKVREDYALTVHLPANNPDECSVYRTDIGRTGSHGAALCEEVKKYRARKGTLTEYTGIGVQPSGWEQLIETARDRAALIEIRDDLKLRGLWDAKYALLCSSKAERLARETG